MREDSAIVMIKMTEGFLTYLKLAFYTGVLLAAIGCAALSILVLGLLARRLPRPARGFGLVIAAVDVWVLWGAGVERLLGW